MKNFKSKINKINDKNNKIKKTNKSIVLCEDFSIFKHVEKLNHQYNKKEIEDLEQRLYSILLGYIMSGRIHVKKKKKDRVIQFQLNHHNYHIIQLFKHEFNLYCLGCSLFRFNNYFKFHTLSYTNFNSLYKPPYHNYTMQYTRIPKLNLFNSCSLAALFILSGSKKINSSDRSKNQFLLELSNKCKFSFYPEIAKTLSDKFEIQFDYNTFYNKNYIIVSGSENILKLNELILKNFPNIDESKIPIFLKTA